MQAILAMLSAKKEDVQQKIKKGPELIIHKMDN